MHGQPKRATPLLAESVDAARRLLDLGETATREELRRAWRRAARRWHPDLAASGERSDSEAGEGPPRHRMERANAAYELLSALMDAYAYSFRPDDVRRDQEPPAVRLRRQFLPYPLTSRHTDRAEVTAERVAQAAARLGLGPTARRERVRGAFRRIVRKRHPDRLPTDERPAAAGALAQVTQAYRYLCHYMRGYRYSLRAADVRRDQEGPDAEYLRRFGVSPPFHE